MITVGASGGTGDYEVPFNDVERDDDDDGDDDG